jgi:two-component sensor histidine kinase
MKPVPEKFLFRRLTITLGLLAIAAAFFGILTANIGISLIGGLDLGNKTIALSAALIWIFLGSVLAYHAAKPLKRPAGLLVLAVLILIAAIETIEFVFSVQAGHFFIETLFVSAGTSVIGLSSSPISPAASGLVIAATFALMFLIGGTQRSDKPMQLPDVISILGLIISLFSITFVLSYAYGNPLLYGTQFIPIAFFSALAAFFTGIAIVTAAGPRAFPARYMTGGSTSARLLRVFVPLVIGIILLENIAFVSLPSWFNIHDAVLLSASLVLFTLATALVISRVSRGMGLALDKAEQELVRKNEELGAMNEELTVIDEELRQTNDNLLLHERQLVQNNDELNELNEELTSTQEELHQNIDELSRREHDLGKALAEKEVLLSEIHHRVKNNLTAFISLLSLEGSTEDTPAGKMLKQDLQNRARSMALIHETLYRTNMYDEVDMGMYLTTLVDQIANSFRMAKGVKTIVDAHGVMLDIPRATPAGLIVNELVTNSFKYAFPESFDSAVARKAPPTITVTFSKDGGEYLLIISDNGIGLPPGFDLTTTKTLGLKLVNFLAKHQMRAKVEVRANKGTEFIFRLNT